LSCAEGRQLAGAKDPEVCVSVINQRASQRLNAKELALLPHFFKVMATMTNGKWTIAVNDDLYRLVMEQADNIGSKISLKTPGSGIRRVIQNLQAVGLLRKNTHGRAIMTSKGVEVASHFLRVHEPSKALASGH
jgi:hypothetical protein